MLDAAHELAADRASAVPPEVAAIPVDRAARRQFSFSRLTGKLVRRNRPWRRAGQWVSRGRTFAPTGARPPRPRLARPRRPRPHRLHAIPPKSPPGANIWPRYMSYTMPAAAPKTPAELIERSSPRRAAANWPPPNRCTAKSSSSSPGRRDRAGGVDGLYLHGFIDCLYQDETGRLATSSTTKPTTSPPPTLPKKPQQYEMQLYVYAMAAERALGASPTELVLHFLRPGDRTRHSPGTTPPAAAQSKWSTKQSPITSPRRRPRPSSP